MVTKDSVHFVVDYLISKIDNNGINLKSNDFNIQYKTELIDLDVNIKLNVSPVLFYHIEYKNQSSSHRSIKGSKSYFYNYLKIASLKKILTDYQNSNIKNTQTVCIEEEIDKLTKKLSSMGYDAQNEDPTLESLLYSLSLDINSWNKRDFILRKL